jgi:hypothetical protein
MHLDDAPPGFWQTPEEASALVDGVELHSSLPTRFFQTLDAYPPEWGRLIWRVQLNRLVDDRAVSPAFRTFYPGIEWNLRHPEMLSSDDRWFLSAWMRWEGAGAPDCKRDIAMPVVQIEASTALFLVATNREQPIFLRSRVDARDRHQIARELDNEPAPSSTPSQGIIRLDDVIERH